MRTCYALLQRSRAELTRSVDVRMRHAALRAATAAVNRARAGRAHHGCAAALARASKPGSLNLAAVLRSTAQSKYEECMELPSVAARQTTPEQTAQVAQLRSEVEDAHKARVAPRSRVRVSDACD